MADKIKAPKKLAAKKILSKRSLEQKLSKLKSYHVARKKARAKIQPHRAFRRTRRRDYVRSLDMPGYIGFTHDTLRVVGRRWRLFGSLALFYTLIVIVAGGVSTQDSYIQIQDMVTSVTDEASEVFPGLGTVANAGIVLLSSFGGSGGFNDAQQIFLVLTVLLLWMTTIWLLREIKAGHKPKMRDGLYSAGSPLISTFIVSLVFLIQLIPLAIVAIVYVSLTSLGLADQGFGSMIAIIGLALTGALTLYWLTSTFVALIIVTLPGMYPMNALKAANDLVISRRLRIMYRLLWMLLVGALGWAVVMVPLVLLEAWLRERVDWLSVIPTIPFLITIMSAITTIWITTYVYLMYRKLVDDDSTPG